MSYSGTDMSPSLDDLINQIGRLEDDEFDATKATSSVSLNYKSSGSVFMRSRSQSQVSFSELIPPVPIPAKTGPRRRKSIAKVFSKSKGKKNSSIQ